MRRLYSFLLSVLCFVALCPVGARANYTGKVYIDNVHFKDVSLPAASDQSTAMDIDVSGLSEGFHTIGIVATDGATVTDYKERGFIKVYPIADRRAMTMHFILDDNDEIRLEGTLSNGSFVSEIDVSDLTDGIHKITCFATDDNNATTMPVTRFFIKQPVGGNGIVKYEWWINDDYESKHTETLSPGVSPLTITGLFDAPVYPFRSSRFHFVKEDEGLRLYARNTFNIFFQDAAGRIGSGSSDYVDYSVERFVRNDDITDLTFSNGLALAEVAPLDKNGIKWYRMECRTGDSVDVVLNRPASIEIYSGSGELCVQSSGAASCVKNGMHCRADGPYFIAVHDANNPDEYINIEVGCIDRHALLDYSPRESGPSDMLFMSFLGNGYDKVKSVELRNSTTSFKATEFFAESRSRLNAVFNLSHAEPAYSLMDLVITYEDAGLEETVIRKRAFKLLPADEGGITVSVEYEEISANPYPVKIRIKNNGSTPCWGIPVQFAWDNIRALRKIAFLDCDVFLLDSIRRVLGAEYQTPIVTVDNLLEQGLEGGYMPLMLPALNAHEEVEVTLGFTCNVDTEFHFYAWAGEPWSVGFPRVINQLRNQEQARSSLVRTASASRASEPTLREHINNWGAEQVTDHALDRLNDAGGGAVRNPAETAANVAEATGQVMGGIVLGAALTNMQAVKDSYGVSDEMWESIGMADRERRMKKAMIHPLEAIAIALGFKDEAEELKETLDMVNSCGNVATPMPQQHLIRNANPFDPNDIHGYKAPSGSEYIGIDVSEIEYVIEFENDPEVATAPANKVVITDILDPKIFDLSSLTTTQIRCGSITLDGETTAPYAKTIDLRPAKDCVVQISTKCDQATGKTVWTIEALDPLTFEPTNLIRRGILPVNDDEGSGTGMIKFHVKLREGLDDATVIDNKAEIVFNSNAQISTPVWKNITDYVRPKSEIVAAKDSDFGEIHVTIETTETGSGVWKTVLQSRSESDDEWTTEEIDGSVAEYAVKANPFIPCQFLVRLIDKAGNVELKGNESVYSYKPGGNPGTDPEHPDNPGDPSKPDDPDNPEKEPDGPTDIKSTLTDIIDGAKAIYDLQGRRISKITSTGIYIIDGKKVFIVM